MRLDLWEGDAGRPALREGEREWTRGELAAAAVRGAAMAEAAGVRAGTCCGLLVRPDAAGITAQAAALASPGAVLALGAGSTPPELAEALGRMRPAAVMLGASTRALAEEALALMPPGGRPALILVGDPGQPPLRIDEGASPVDAGASTRAPIDPDHALVIWTSGTTGSPRAVALRGEGVLDAARAQIARLGIAKGDSMVASLPLAPVGGLMVPVRAALAGAVIEALATGDATPATDALVALAGAGRADHVSLVPVVLLRLVEALEGADGGTPPVRFGTLLIGGAACPPDLVARAHACGLEVALTWGMTESCAQVATALAGDVRRDPRSVGRALDHVVVRVEADGRLALHLPALAPAEVVPDGALRPLCDGEGWFVTGDLGYVADDGRIFITGRISDRIITGGVNVDPGEVEAVLRAHPAVADAVVVGMPDADWGERVCAAVVLADALGDAGADPETSGMPDVLSDWVRERLSAAKRPRAWRVVRQIPSTAAGKIDRAGVRALFDGA